MIDAIKQVAKDMISEVVCFDVYSGKNIDADKKSLGFSIRMQNDNGVVSEGESEAIMKKAIETIGSRFGAKLRD